ncbi:MAG: hypothetical protein NVV59_12455 [Chitinophagaceae bacterium]|nr:hypothetical protein [Chitinophagaceae bacterium]
MKTSILRAGKTMFFCAAAFIALSACEGQNDKPTTAPLPPATPAMESTETAPADNTNNGDTASYDRMSGRGFDSTTKQ